MGRGTVDHVDEDGRVMIALDSGALSIAKVFGASGLSPGDRVSGVPPARGGCIARNESTQRDVVLYVESTNVTPRAVARFRRRA